MPKSYKKIRTPSAVVFAGAHAQKKGCRLEYRARSNDYSSGHRITADQARQRTGTRLFRRLRENACRRGEATTAYEYGLITARKKKSK